jgi:hypothetical protein
MVCSGGRQKKYKNNLPFTEKYGEFEYSCCDDCGHISVHESLSDTRLGQDHLKKNIENSEVPDTVAARAQSIVSKLPVKSGRIYDIGAGNCNFSAAFSRLGYTGVAVDVHRFNEIYPHFVEADNFVKDVRANGAVAIFSNHSFEHIPTEDLRSMMADLRDFVQNGTRCFFIMPSAKVSLAKVGVCLEEFAYGHKNLFTTASAKLFFGGIFPADDGFTIHVAEHRTRLDFMRTRLRILMNYAGGLHFFKFAALLGYMVKCVLVGCRNEISVEVRYG